MGTRKKRERQLRIASSAVVEAPANAFYDRLNRILDVHIVAMQAVIPLRRRKHLNINSGTAFMTVPQRSVYSSSKRALLGFSLTARAGLEKNHTVVREIYPFITATNFGKNRMGILCVLRSGSAGNLSSGNDMFELLSPKARVSDN